MIQLLKKTPNIDFFKHGILFSILSLIILIAGVVAMFTKGFKLGIDFQGGSIIQVKLDKAYSTVEITNYLHPFFPTLAGVTEFGSKQQNEFLISLAQEEATEGVAENLTASLEQALQGKIENYEIRRIERVGPKVGAEIYRKALFSILYALIGILIYVWIRFTKVSYGIGSIVALLHDVLIIVSVFVLLEREFNLTTVAALLTVVGYSLNDTIVIFDRIRENRSLYLNESIRFIINLSINECLSRTLLTSLTTLLVVIILYIFGGEIINNFSFAILIGLIVGTYSSIYIASQIVIFLQKFSSPVEVTSSS